MNFAKTIHFPYPSAASVTDAPVDVTQAGKPEFVTFENISVGKSGGTVSISGVSNSSKLTFSLGSGDIEFSLPSSYLAAGSSTANGYAIDGIKKLLIAGANNTDLPINVLTGLGELDPDHLFDYIEDYDRKIDPLYINQPVIHFVSETIARRWLTEQRALGFYQITVPGQINNNIDFTKHSIVGLPSMNGTKDIFSTLKSNMIYLTKREANADGVKVDVQVHHRAVDILFDGWRGFGFGTNAMVWTNEATVNKLPTPPESSGSGSGS